MKEIRIVVTEDSPDLVDYLCSPEGEKVMSKVMQKNADRIREALDIGKRDNPKSVVLIDTEQVFNYRSVLVAKQILGDYTVDGIIELLDDLLEQAGEN